MWFYITHNIVPFKKNFMLFGRILDNLKWFKMMRGSFLLLIITEE
jgi:hypothetical protein